MLRVVSYNVCRFQDFAGGSSVLTVAKALGALQPAVICLNEVDLGAQPDALERLVDTLEGDWHTAFYGHFRGNYGNAVVSRHPIRHVRSVTLDGGSVVTDRRGKPHRIVRGLLIATFEMPRGESVQLACTHLDHMSTAQRQVQLRHVLAELLPSSHSHTLLVGDLNALRREDYSAQQWRLLETRAESKGWELPQAGDLELLCEQGFVDAGEAAGRTDFTAPVGEPKYRIDYCFYKGDSLDVSAVTVPQVTASDHYPLVVDLKFSLHSAL